MLVHCPRCQKQMELDPSLPLCPCGQAWEPLTSPSVDTDLIDLDDHTLWRYRKLLGNHINSPYVTLGEGCTPLVPYDVGSMKALCKLEYLSPTGSFKDRGTTLMINTLIKQKVTQLVEDSSGNAGASIAAYASRAGIRADIFAPTSASEGKKKLITAFGGNLHLIEGARSASSRAAVEFSGSEIPLAMHAIHPAFLLGMQTAAFEIWEDMGGDAPDWIIVPVGQGLLFLGLWMGFKRVLASKLIKKLPRMVAVQARACSPVVQAFERAVNEVDVIIPDRKPSIAEGVAITKPLRGFRILKAIYETDGEAMAIEENEIIAAQNDAFKHGFSIEPTSALTIAAFRRMQDKVQSNERAVLMLTGSGLKNR